jgi:predicted membrane-bound spermidine synthase
MKPATFLLPIFVAGGAAALIYEVVWFQLLALQVGGATRAIAIVLATFMAGLGAGALLIPRLIPSTTDPLRACAALEAFTALCGLAMPGAIVATGGFPATLQWLAVSLLILIPTLGPSGPDSGPRGRWPVSMRPTRSGAWRAASSPGFTFSAFTTPGSRQSSRRR